MALHQAQYEIFHDLQGLLLAHGVIPGQIYLETLGHYFSDVVAYNSPAMRGLVETLLSSPTMVAFNLLQNAVDEAKGGARVQIMAERYAKDDLRTKMLTHAQDEFRHSTQFLGLIKFTGIQTESAQNEEEKAECFVETQQVFDFDDTLTTFIARVHSIEIRSWTILRLYIDILEGYDDSKLKLMIPVLRQIMADETRHVAYTGKQVSDWLEQDPAYQHEAIGCLAHTNNETWEDFARMSRYLADNHSEALENSLLKTPAASLSDVSRVVERALLA